MAVVKIARYRYRIATDGIVLASNISSSNSNSDTNSSNIISVSPHFCHLQPLSPHYLDVIHLRYVSFLHHPESLSASLCLPPISFEELSTPPYIPFDLDSRVAVSVHYPPPPPPSGYQSPAGSCTNGASTWPPIILILWIYAHASQVIGEKEGGEQETLIDMI